jgi:uncharacterized protein with PQ loop repeat
MGDGYGYLMNIASISFIACYFPELYANYKNKNANMYNVPEKIIMLIGSLFAFSYSALNNNTELMINYGPILSLDIIAFIMRIYYVYINKSPVVVPQMPKSESQVSLNELSIP